MADLFLQTMLIHIVNVYHLVVSEAADGQQLEAYPDTFSPDIENLRAHVTRDGKALLESPVGYAIESDAIMYCEAADVRERDRIHWGADVYYVNGTPSTYHSTETASPNTPHLMQIGLRQDKTEPG